MITFETVTFVLSCFTAVVCILMLVRTEVVYRARSKAIDACYLLGDYSAYHEGPTWNEATYSLHKWTFAQFYPELCK